MKIQYSNVNFINDIILPNEINEINKYILQVCKTLPALNITSDAKLLNETIDIVNNFANEKKLFIVFGTGGSSLGARALINISNNVNNNIIFFDNIDPVFFEKSFKNLDFNSTGFIVISKSGTTLETLSQFGSIVE